MADFNKGCRLLVKNASLLWPHLEEDKPDTKYGAVWSVVLELDEATADELTKLGFNVKDGKLKVKKNVTVKGVRQAPPKIVDKDGRTPFPAADIGNGTVANVELFCKKYDISEFVSGFINVVQVIEVSGNSLITPVED